MTSYVYKTENLSQSKIFTFYRKQAQMLKLMTPETPVLLFIGKGNMFSKWPYLICTNENVIMIDPIRTSKYTVMPYISISSCTILPGIVPKIAFGIIGRPTVEYSTNFLNRPDAMTVCNFITGILQSSKNSNNGSSNNSISDIEKLAELRDKGLISEDEFQMKKKQLLGI